MNERVIAAVTRKLIYAHVNKNEKSFCEWANYLADAYERQGDIIGARLTRAILQGKLNNTGH